MIRLPAAIARCTTAGASWGIVASPSGRILDWAPGVIGPVRGRPRSHHPVVGYSRRAAVAAPGGCAAASLAGLGVLAYELVDLRPLGRIVVPGLQRGGPVGGGAGGAQHRGGDVDGVDLVVNVRRLRAAWDVGRDLALVFIPGV